MTEAQRLALLDRQEPFAIVLGCSDSRVPAELIFDQGFGDLFVIRVAGNIVAPSQVGSVEFAAARFGTRLVVVMGHSQCGVVVATLEELMGKTTNQTHNLRSIRDAVRANVRASTNHLRHGSALLEWMIENDGLIVVGAEYSLETGKVDFFDGAPDLS